jgi:ketosteroid isomerase-like protein
MMHATRAWEVVREVFSAYEENDRARAEAVLADDCTFSSPPDPHLVRVGYFERSWPNSEAVKASSFQRVAESDGEVFVTYELGQNDGSRGRNTEFFVVDGGEIKRCEVYFDPSL